MSKNDHNKTIEDLRETVAGHSRRMDGDRPPRRETAAIMAAQLLALETGRIADAADNVATLLASGLGKGSPLIEALWGATSEDRSPRRGVNLIPTTVLQAELRRREVEERPDNEDDRERERERERERVRAQMKEQERRP
jgi:hypothetical protein